MFTFAQDQSKNDLLNYLISKIMEKYQIGFNAGKVWVAIQNKRAEFTLEELANETGLTIQSTLLAVGWLARENKISVRTQDGELRLASEDLGFYY